jgi:hypothetical protein
MFNQTQSNILDGLLLGDASIPAGQNLLHFSQRSDRREYVERIAEQLGVSRDRVRDRARQPDTRTGRVYRCSELRTLSDPVFGALRTRWYPDGRKVMPRDLRISPECVLNWFLCDGSCSPTRGGAQLMLCTDAFSPADLEFVRGLLAGADIEVNICGRRLRVRQNSVARFYDYIGPCPISCFAYKWVSEELRHPPRQVDLRPHYKTIHNLYVVNDWSCERIAKKFNTNYFSIRYILKGHFGIRFGKNAGTETTCREGVVAPSETARRASSVLADE